jgi:hemoglobin/transferrin/lactoferrin receptor protein
MEILSNTVTQNGNSKVLWTVLTASALIASTAMGQPASDGVGMQQDQPKESATENQSNVDITVVATRKPEPTLETAGTATAVGSESILSIGSVSLADALKYEPNVSVPFDFAGESGLVPYLGGGTQSINIRGLEGNRVAIFVDGIRQPEDFVAQSFLGQGGPGRIYFDPAVLNQLEIFKSASSSLYGSDALGGTLAAQTVDPLSLLGESLTGNIVENSLTYASLNESINNRLTAAWGDGNLATSLVYSFRDGNETINNSNVEPNPQNFESNATVWKVLYSQPTWSVEGAVDHFKSETFTDANAAEGSFFGGAIVNENITQDDERERLRFSVEGIIKPEGGMALFDTLTSQLYWQDSSFDTVNVQEAVVSFGPPTQRDRRNIITYDTEIYGLDIQADKSIFGDTVSHEISYGLELSHREISNDFERIDFDPFGNPTVSNRIGMAPTDVKNLGFFIRDEIILGTEARWGITPGIRVDMYDVSPDNTNDFLARTLIPGTTQSVEAVDYDNVAIAPSFSVLYALTKNTNIYGLYGRGVRNPTAEELNGVFTHGTDFIVVPNKDLEEETSDSFEIGMQVSTEQHAFQIAGFYNFYDNFLESNVLVQDNPDPDPDVLNTVNRGNSEIYGVELSWDWRISETLLGVEGFESGANFGWTEGEDTDTSEPLNSIDPWKLVAYLGYEEPEKKWGARLTATHISEKGREDISGDLDTVDNVTLFDLVGHVQLSQNWSLRGGINNLTDEEYFLWATARRGGGHGGEEGGRNTQPGRNLFVSLNANF